MKRKKFVNNEIKEDYFTDIESLLDMRNYQRATNLIAMLLRKYKLTNSDKSRLYFWLGIIYLITHRYDEAILNLNNAILNQFESHQAWFLLSYVYDKIGNFNNSLHTIKMALQIQPSEIKYLERLATLLQYQGKLNEAIICYNKIISIDNENIQALRSKGEILKYMKKYEESLSIFKRLININPKDYSAIYNMGYLNEMLGKDDKALVFYHQVVHANKDFYQATIRQGIIYYNNEEFDKALDEFIRLTNFFPDYYQAWINLGSTYASINQIEKAKSCYKRGLEIYQNDYIVWYNLGILCFIDDNLEEAINNFRKSLEFKPDQYEIFNFLGIFYLKLNDIKKAVENFNQANRLKPKDFAIQNNFGVLYSYLKDYEKAKYHLRMAEEYNPQNEGVNRNLKIIEVQSFVEEISQEFNLKYKTFIEFERLILDSPEIEKSIEEHAKDNPELVSLIRELFYSELATIGPSNEVRIIIETMPKRKTRIGLLTAINVEKEIVNRHFKLKREMDEDNHPYYSGTLKHKVNQRDFDIIHYSLGKGSEIVYKVNRIIKHNPDFIFLVGISGGIKRNKVKIGDIIIATEAIYYEFQSITEGFLKDPKYSHLSTDPFLKHLAKSYPSEPVEKDWYNRRKSTKINDEIRKILKLSEFEDYQPEILDGPFFCGEKVIRKSVFVKRKLLKHQHNAIGVEMESYHFMKSIIEAKTQRELEGTRNKHNISYIVIKSVSDYADKPNRKKWKKLHDFAANRAAVFLYYFLKEGPLKPN